MGSDIACGGIDRVVYIWGDGDGGRGFEIGDALFRPPGTQCRAARMGGLGDRTRQENEWLG